MIPTEIKFAPHHPRKSLDNDKWMYLYSKRRAFNIDLKLYYSNKILSQNFKPRNVKKRMVVLRPRQKKKKK